MREELSHRPLVLGFMAMVCGLSVWFVPWLLLSLVGLLWLARGWLGRGVVFGSLMLGLWLAPRPATSFFHGRQLFERDMQVLGVAELTENGSRVTALDGQVRYRLRLSGAPHLVHGDIVRVRGEKVPLSEGSGWADGCSAAIVVGNWDVLRGGWSFLRPGLEIRDSVNRFVGSSTDDRVGSFLRAVTLGDTSDVTNSEWDSFQRSGTTHIVSTSGLHASVVCAAIFFLASLLPIGRIWQIGLIVPLLMLYASAAGFGAPIVRACLMVLGYSMAYLFRREPDGLSAVSGAGILGLLIEPADVFGTGYWLSVLAVGSLVMMGPWDSAQARWRRLLEADLRVFVVTSPLVAAAFGRISLIGSLANIVAVPVVSFLVVGCLGSWLISLLSPPLGRVIVQVALEPVGQGFLNFVAWVSDWRFAIFEAPYVSAFVVVVMVASMILLWRPRLREA